MKLWWVLSYLAACWVGVICRAQSEATEVPVEGTFLRRDQWSAEARAGFSSSTKQLDDKRNLIFSEGQVTGNPTLSPFASAKLVLRGTEVDGPRTVSTHQLTLVQGYLALEGTRFRVKIGRQIVAWGRGDAVNPTDNLSPRDYTTLLSGDEDQRLGIPSIRTDWFFSANDTLTVFGAPYFKPSTFPLPGASGQTFAQTRQGWSWNNWAAGTKFDHRGETLDWSISYFRGRQLLPVLQLNEVFPPPTLELSYPEIQVIGADFARNYGRYSLRGEAAYINPTRSPTAINPLRPSPYFFGVLGIDRTWLESLNINFQIVGWRSTDYQDPATLPNPLQRGIALQNAITFGQVQATSYGLTLRIGDHWLHETLQAEAWLLWDLRPNSYYFRPTVTYAVNDRFRIELGAEIYSGDNDSFFGRLKQNQRVFLETKLSL